MTSELEALKRLLDTASSPPPREGASGEDVVPGEGLSLSLAPAPRSSSSSSSSSSSALLSSAPPSSPRSISIFAD